MGAARLDVASQLGFDALPVLLSRIVLPGIAGITRYSASVPCLVLPGIAVVLHDIGWYCIAVVLYCTAVVLHGIAWFSKAVNRNHRLGLLGTPPTALDAPG